VLLAFFVLLALGVLFAPRDDASMRRGMVQ
jgi:hypothetical protein